MMWWEEKVYPIFIVKGEKGNRKAYNLIASPNYCVSVEMSGERSIIPNFFKYKRDVWEKIYSFDESIILDQLERCDYNLHTEGIYYNLFVELLAAYDISKNETLYNIAKYLSNKFEKIDSQNQNGIINRLQLIKRKRALTEIEISELEKIYQSPSDDMVCCAVEILFENKYNAKKKIEALSPESKEIFKTFPICNLL